MPLSILSDIEEFDIYDTRIKPVKNDPSSEARMFYCTFDQYAEK
jgi:adenine-specific DNA-methyltransferase